MLSENHLVWILEKEIKTSVPAEKQTKVTQILNMLRETSIKQEINFLYFQDSKEWMQLCTSLKDFRRFITTFINTAYKVTGF